MLPNFEIRHFLNKSVTQSTDEELIEALNKCYRAMEFFPLHGCTVGSEIRHCYNVYEAELLNRGKKVKLVIDGIK